MKETQPLNFNVLQCKQRQRDLVVQDKRLTQCDLKPLFCPCRWVWWFYWKKWCIQQVLDVVADGRVDNRNMGRFLFFLKHFSKKVVLRHIWWMIRYMLVCTPLSDWIGLMPHAATVPLQICQSLQELHIQQFQYYLPLCPIFIIVCQKI